MAYWTLKNLLTSAVFSSSDANNSRARSFYSHMLYNKSNCTSKLLTRSKHVCSKYRIQFLKYIMDDHYAAKCKSVSSTTLVRMGCQIVFGSSSSVITHMIAWYWICCCLRFSCIIVCDFDVNILPILHVCTLLVKTNTIFLNEIKKIHWTC